MDTVKRDFNGAAHFFLGLSMFAVAMAIITSAMNISNYNFFGIGNTGILIKEIVFDALILVAGVLTFMKKPYGLIALTLLFIIRMFATVDYASSLSVAGQLGGKTALLIRDFGLFAIAMCFRKNGISGWKSMLASEEYVKANTIIPVREERHPEDSDSASEQSEESFHERFMPMQEDTSTAISQIEPAPVEETKSIEVSIPGPKENELGEIENQNKARNKISFIARLKNLPKAVKIGLVSLLGIIVLIGAASVIVAVKSYPEYISTFGDKWRYTFNLPNNNLARSLMSRVYSSRDKSSHLVVIPGYNDEVLDSEKFYRLRVDLFREYPSTAVYTAAIIITRVEDIASNQYYIIEPKSGDPYAYKGSKISSDWSFYGDTKSRTVYQTKEYNYEKSLAKEIGFMDEAALIPVTDICVIREIGGFYEHEGILSKAADYYRFALKKNRNNAAVRGLLAYALALNGDSEEAREEAEIALKKDPKEPKALSALAIVESEDFNWGEAKKYSKKAIDYGSEDSNVYYVYCASLYKQGEIKAAQNYYNKAYQLYRFNPRREKYAEYAGCPFEVLEFHYGSSTESKVTIPKDEKLVSSKCYYIDFWVDVNILRKESSSIGVKLYKNGSLMTGQGSKDGYTYYDEIGNFEPGQRTISLYGWGNNSGGAWPSGHHSIEIWYKGKKVAEDSFRIY